MNAESTFSKLLEFEYEMERLGKLQEEAALAAAAAVASADSNANTNTKRQYFRKKVNIFIQILWIQNNNNIINVVGQLY